MKYENDLIDLFVKCKDAEMKKKGIRSYEKNMQNGKIILLLH